MAAGANLKMATSVVLSVDLTDLPDKRTQISAEITSAAIDVGFFYVTGKHCSAAFNAGPVAAYIDANARWNGYCRTWNCASRR